LGSEKEEREGMARTQGTQMESSHWGMATCNKQTRLPQLVFWEGMVAKVAS